MNKLKVPILGVIAWSGTGKTTLLTQLIPLLKCRGLRIALIKHAHHQFEIDHPGKDSYRLRKAGAVQMVIASKHRIASIKELPDNDREPSLEDILENIDLENLDLILVEGFKMADIPKIELHRQSLNKPYLYPKDKNIIALAQDQPDSEMRRSIRCLDLNHVEQIADFMGSWIASRRSNVVSLVKS